MPWNTPFWLYDRISLGWTLDTHRCSRVFIPWICLATESGSPIIRMLNDMAAQNITSVAKYVPSVWPQCVRPAHKFYQTKQRSSQPWTKQIRSFALVWPQKLSLEPAAVQFYRGRAVMPYLACPNWDGCPSLTTILCVVSWNFGVSRLWQIYKHEKRQQIKEST